MVAGAGERVLDELEEGRGGEEAELAELLVVLVELDEFGLFAHAAEVVVVGRLEGCGRALFLLCSRPLEQLASDLGKAGVSESRGEGSDFGRDCESLKFHIDGKVPLCLEIVFFKIKNCTTF